MSLQDPRKEKRILVKDTFANIKSKISDRMFVMSSDSDSDANVEEGTSVWRSGNDLKIGAIQASVNKSTGVVTPANNIFGDVDVRGTLKDGVSKPNGFNNSRSDLANYASFVFDNGTRIATFSMTDNSDTDISVNGERIIIPDADSRLTAAAVPVGDDAEYWYYFDDDGQLKAIAADIVSNNFFYTKCLVAQVYYSTTGLPILGSTPGCEIYIIKQWHRAEGTDWRGIHHVTEGSKIIEGGFEVTPEAEGDYRIAMASGTVIDEDIVGSFPAVDKDSGVWPVYYYEGQNSQGDPNTKRGDKTAGNLNKPFVTSHEAGVAGGDSNIIYNDMNGGNPVVNRLDDGQYVLAHIFVANGTLAHNSIITGQMAYNSVSLAREGAITEINELAIDNDVVREAVHVASVILDSSGNVAKVNNDGLLVIDVRPQENKNVFGGSDEVCIPDGEGRIKSTQSLNLQSLQTETSTVLRQFSSSAGEFLRLGANGVVSTFDLLGSSGSSAYEDFNNPASTFTTDNGSPTAYTLLASVATPSEGLLSGDFTFEIDTLLYPYTEGMYVRIDVDGTPVITDLLFDGEYSAADPITIVQSYVLGAIAGDVTLSVYVRTKADYSSAEVYDTSVVTLTGEKPASSSDSYFVLSENGVGTGTHTFETVVVNDIDSTEDNENLIKSTDSQTFVGADARDDLSLLSTNDPRARVGGIFYDIITDKNLNDKAVTKIVGSGVTASSEGQYVRDTSGDVDGSFVFSYTSPTNIDHIWYDDSDGSGGFNFVADSALGATANARIRCAELYCKGISTTGIISYNGASDRPIDLTSTDTYCAIRVTDTDGNVEYATQHGKAKIRVNGSTKLDITDDGRVGIGDSSPGANLHVKFDSGAFYDINDVTGILIENERSNSEAAVAFRTGDDTTEQWYIGRNQGAGFAIAYGTVLDTTSSALRIVGSAGAFVTKIADELEVNGDIDLNGNMVVSGTINGFELATDDSVTNPAVANGSGTGYSYRKYGNGMVVVSVYGTGSGSGTSTLVTLDAGLKPYTTLRQMADDNNNTYLQITSSGELQVVNQSTGVAYRGTFCYMAEA